MSVFYTDGSCRPANPGPGSFGVIGVDYNDIDKKEKITYCYYKKFDYTTNNRMELSAISHVMQNFGVNISNSNEEIPTVYSDSSYAINVFTKWMFIWEERGWAKANGDVPENLDIIINYYKKYQQGYRIKLEKVQAHSTNKWNNVVDEYIINGELNYE